MPGMGHSKKWWDMYEALRRDGKSKESAAKITNSKFGSKKRTNKKHPTSKTGRTPKRSRKRTQSKQPRKRRYQKDTGKLGRTKRK